MWPVYWVQHWYTERLNWKLEKKYHGPYQVIWMIKTHAYKLNIQNIIPKNCTFMVFLLHTAINKLIPG